MPKYSVEELEMMYKWGVIDATYLQNAVFVGWITEEEKMKILGNV